MRHVPYPHTLQAILRKYYAIHKNENLEHYMKSLRDKELKYYKDNFGISIND